VLLDRLQPRRVSDDDRRAALARLRAFAAGEAQQPSAGHRSEESAAGVRIDPGRHGLLALIAVAVVAALAAGALYLRARPQPVEVPSRVAAGQPLVSTSPSAAAEVVVDVAGRVAHPGVVTLPLGSRVGDALRAAGGALPGVDLSSLNLARKLVDGEQVLVGVVPPPGAVAGAPAGGGLVNLNSATAEQLESLPGVGPVLAQRIVDWRQTHGGFRSVEQLREVSGIGAAKYADLKSKVTV
jgi:competence protein ComEA